MCSVSYLYLFIDSRFPARHFSFLTLSESKQAMTRPLSTWQLLAGWANLHSWSEREQVPLWNSRHTSSVSHFVSRMCVMFIAISRRRQKKVFRAEICSKTLQNLFKLSTYSVVIHNLFLFLFTSQCCHCLGYLSVKMKWNTQKEKFLLIDWAPSPK